MSDTPIQAFKGKSSFNFRSEWKIFAWCFIIASVFWLMTALNEPYTSSLTIQARYINLSKEKVFVKPLPEEFKIMVTGRGWDLLSHRFRKNTDFITVDLNDYKKMDVLISRRLMDNFQQVIGQKITIGEVFPETISLQKEAKGIKKVPVHLIQDLSYKNQYGLGGDISFSPDSVTVSGPVSLIKDIDHIDTETASDKEISKTENIDVKLRDPEFKNIGYNVASVKVNIPVYQLTEQKADITLEVLNPGKTLNMILIPTKVTVIYQTPINRFSKIDSIQFQAVVDGSQVDTVSKQPLKVQLISSPRFTYNVRLNPDFVDYVLEK